MWWEANLPHAVEAFVFADATHEQTMRISHVRFLTKFGLRAEDVPLLRYDCFVTPLNPVNKPAGECFVDVS